MKDIVARMRETAESGDIGPGASEEVLELIDYVQILEKQLEQPQKQLNVALKQTERAWQERDAALERVRVLEASIGRFRDFANDFTRRDQVDDWVDSDDRKSAGLNRSEAIEELFELLEA